MLNSSTIQPGTSYSGNLLQFLAWVASRPRTYDETMDAWRTSCPRLSAWEDATTDGLVEMECTKVGKRRETLVLLTEKGATLFKDSTPNANNRGARDELVS